MSLLFVSDRKFDTSFLVDSDTQMSLIPNSKEDKVKGPFKFTLQAVIESLISTQGQKCLSLNLGVRRISSTDLERVMLGSNFGHKYGLLIDRS